MNRRFCIKLNPFEHNTLARLYVAKRIASDRYMQLPDHLIELTETFNSMTGRDDSPDEVLHYMQTKRRTKGAWPTLDGNHLRIESVLGNVIDCEHEEVLCHLYREFGEGVERFAQDSNLGGQLSRRFAEESGNEYPGWLLAGALLEIRKAGDLPKLPERDDDFGDFDDAERLSE